MKKKYAYKLTPLLWVLFISGLLVAGYCVFANLTRFIKLLDAPEAGTYNYIASILSAVIGLAAFVFIPPAMINSCYLIDDKHLTASWGIVKNKYDLKDITSVTHFRLTKKLVVYFKDESYTVINVSPELFDEFVQELKERNKNIFYALNTEDKGEK